MVTWAPAIPDVGLMAVIFGGIGIAGMLFLQAMAIISKPIPAANSKVSFTGNLFIGNIISNKKTSYEYINRALFSERRVWLRQLHFCKQFQEVFFPVPAERDAFSVNHQYIPAVAADILLYIIEVNDK